MSVNVTNTGSVAGDEVVQLYVRDIISSSTVYEKNLRGFERVHLLPGETMEVVFRLCPDDLASYYSAAGKRVVEPGEFRIMAGASSEDIRLSDTLAVIPYPGSEAVLPERALAERHSADGADMTYGEGKNPVWSGKAGDFMTIPVEPGKKMAGVAVSWGELPDDGALSFEIQVSSGGGQFLTVWSGKAAPGEQICRFGKVSASDCRILLKSSSASIDGVRIRYM